jgi:large subunit ribosomal protein L7/L12
VGLAGVDMMPQMMMGGPAAAAAPAAEEAPKVEKDIFDVKLDSFDAAAKIKVIKEVRAITGLGLKEAKDLVEGVPKVMKKGISKKDAEEIVAKLKEVGAVVVME